MEIFKRLFSSLNSESLRYMVVGGIAVNLYGIERATADIDVVVRLDKENLLRFVGIAKKLGLKPKLPVKLEEFVDADKRKEWVENKGMTVFSLYDARNPFFLLDVFVETPFDFDEVHKQRKKIKFEDTVIPVADAIMIPWTERKPSHEKSVAVHPCSPSVLHLSLRCVVRGDRPRPHCRPGQKDHHQDRDKGEVLRQRR